MPRTKLRCRKCHEYRSFSRHGLCYSCWGEDYPEEKETHLRTRAERKASTPCDRCHKLGIFRSRLCLECWKITYPEKYEREKESKRIVWRCMVERKREERRKSEVPAYVREMEQMPVVEASDDASDYECALLDQDFIKACRLLGAKSEGGKIMSIYFESIKAAIKDAIQDKDCAPLQCSDLYMIPAVELDDFAEQAAVRIVSKARECVVVNLTVEDHEERPEH